MVLFLLFFMFLVFNEYLYIDTNIVLFVYFVYVCINILMPNSTILTPIINQFWFKKQFFFFRFFFQRSLNFFFKFRSFFFKPRLVWKPLFKKSSYFGLYRSNRNQWLNK